VPGERGELLFAEKEVPLSPPGPLSPFKKNGILAELVQEYRFFVFLCFGFVYCFAFLLLK